MGLFLQQFGDDELMMKIIEMVLDWNIDFKFLVGRQVGKFLIS